MQLASCQRCGGTDRYANGRCKPCHRTATKVSRKRNWQRFLERERRYKQQRGPEARAKQRQIDQVRQAAGTAVYRALKRGVLIRPDYCEECGVTGLPIEAAHYDYTRPLDVRWLCRPCHSHWDRAEPKSKIDPTTLASFGTIPNAKIDRSIADWLRKNYQPGLVTQSELGHRVGLSQGHVSRILLGQHWRGTGC